MIDVPVQSSKAQFNQESRDFCLSRIWKRQVVCSVRRMRCANPDFQSNTVDKQHVVVIKKSFLTNGVAMELATPMLGACFLGK